MDRKPHICMVGSGSGAWAVHGRTRLIGKNNVFRTFDEACAYAKHLRWLYSDWYQRQMMYQHPYPGGHHGR